MSNDVLASFRLDARAVQGTAMPVADATTASDGKSLPPAGGEAPPRTQRPEIKLPDPPDLSRMIEKLNDYLRQNSLNLQFHHDDSSGRTIITVVDATTGEIVRQIPSEELLAMAQRMLVEAQSGSLIDARA